MTDFALLRKINNFVLNLSQQLPYENRYSTTQCDVPAFVGAICICPNEHGRQARRLHLRHQRRLCLPIERRAQCRQRRRLRPHGRSYPVSRGLLSDFCGLARAPALCAHVRLRPAAFLSDSEQQSAERHAGIELPELPGQFGRTPGFCFPKLPHHHRRDVG